jgi:hypothetical protein
MNILRTSLTKHLGIPTLIPFLSNRRRSAPVIIAVVTVGVALAWPFTTGKTYTNTPTVTVVMSGLDNPRGLAFGDDDDLYVAEAGRGGSGPCLFLRGALQCYGATGAVSRLRDGVQQRIITGLPSYAASTGQGATGPHDVSVPDENRIYIAIGLGGGPAVRTAFDSDFGWLVRAGESGLWARFADIAGFEFSNNPDMGVPDSNPYGLLTKGGGHIVVDAGGNSLLRVSANGNIVVIATFPSRAQGRGTDAVPTSVARGPDGAYYVGELTGVPFTVGAARVYRVVPGQAPTIFRSGFTAIIDLAFGPDGSLYVLQHATRPGLSGPGALIRVAPDGTRTTIASVGLFNPTALLIADVDEAGVDSNDVDHNNENNDEGNRIAFYISNCGTCAGAGEVIRIEP